LFIVCWPPSLRRPQASAQPEFQVPWRASLRSPAKIEGALELNTGADLFQFEATAGQILTCYVLAGEDSNLDAYLTVELPEGTLLSYSDQNGLIDRSDSFVQMVIPEEGTYVVRVEDFLFRTGANFGYELSVNVESP
jgi:hypothetical protein